MRYKYPPSPGFKELQIQPAGKLADLQGIRDNPLVPRGHGTDMYMRCVFEFSVFMSPPGFQGGSRPKQQSRTHTACTRSPLSRETRIQQLRERSEDFLSFRLASMQLLAEVPSHDRLRIQVASKAPHAHMASDLHDLLHGEWADHRHLRGDPR